MSSGRIAILERTLDRVRQRAAGPHPHLRLGHVLEPAIGGQLDAIDENAAGDLYEALTSPGHETDLLPAADETAAAAPAADETARAAVADAPVVPAPASATSDVADAIQVEDDEVSIDDDDDLAVLDDVGVGIEVDDDEEVIAVEDEATIVDDIDYDDEDIMFEGSTMVSEVEDVAARKRREAAGRAPQAVSVPPANQPSRSRDAAAARDEAGDAVKAADAALGGTAPGVAPPDPQVALARARALGLELDAEAAEEAKAPVTVDAADTQRTLEPPFGVVRPRGKRDAGRPAADKRPAAAAAPGPAVPSHASFAVPAAPQAAPALREQQLQDPTVVVIAPVVTERPAVAAVQVADMLGDGATTRQRSFRDTIAGTLALGFRPPPGVA